MKQIAVIYHSGDRERDDLQLSIQVGTEPVFIYTGINSYFAKLFWRLVVSKRAIRSFHPRRLTVRVTDRECEILSCVAKHGLAQRYGLWRDVLKKGLTGEDALRYLEHKISMTVLTTVLNQQGETR